MSPAAVTSGAATLSMSQSQRTAPAATPRVMASTTTDDSAPPTTEMTTKSATRDGVGHAEGDRHRLGQHGQRERDRQGERERGEDVLADHRVRPPRQAEGAGVDGGAEPAAEGAEDVAPHADGRGDEHQQAGQRVEGVGDGAEGQPGEEVTAAATSSAATPCHAPAASGPSAARMRLTAPTTGRPPAGHGGRCYDDAPVRTMTRCRSSAWPRWLRPPGPGRGTSPRRPGPGGSTPARGPGTRRRPGCGRPGPGPGLSASRSRSAWRFWASRMSGAAYAAWVEKARFSRMNGYGSNRSDDGGHVDGDPRRRRRTVWSDEEAGGAEVRAMPSEKRPKASGS